MCTNNSLRDMMHMRNVCFWSIISLTKLYTQSYKILFNFDNIFYYLHFQYTQKDNSQNTVKIFFTNLCFECGVVTLYLYFIYIFKNGSVSINSHELYIIASRKSRRSKIKNGRVRSYGHIFLREFQFPRKFHKKNMSLAPRLPDLILD